MVIKTIDKTSINEVIKILESGGLVIYPTETVYGIGVDATNQQAVNKLNVYKQRPYGKPYSIAVADQKMAEKYVDLNSTAKKVYKQFLPGPLTIVSKGKGVCAKGVESENGTLGIRIPDYQFVLQLVKKLGKPITATSANASYQKRPYKIADILDNISNKQKMLIDLIVGAGELPTNEPSTVIDTTLDDPMILRQGEIKLKDSFEVLSRSVENTQNMAKELLQKYWQFLGKRPIVFALEGQMGTGKTQFAKGVGKTLGIKDEILSPTFNLLLSYKVENPKGLMLEHFDTWRVEDPKEIEALGFSNMIKGKDKIIIIEWSDKIADLIRSISEDALVIWVKIQYGKNDNDRLISWGNM